MRKLKIEIKKLSKNFEKRKVLKDLDLNIYESESLSIIGESGSGKSVLARCITGLSEFEKGKILIDNSNDVMKMSSTSLNKHISKFGILFQNSALLDSLNIEENLKFTNKNINLSEILNEINLSKKILKKFPAELSVGDQKRIGLARAILKEPEILILDEPTTGLDPLISNQINILVKSIVEKKKITAVTITHDMTSVNEYGEKVAFLKNGKIEWYGNAKKIYSAKNKNLKNFIEGVL